MVKKIIIILSILFLSFIIFNYKTFLSSYYFVEGNKKYVNNNFSGAIENYEKSIFYKNNFESNHNLGNSYLFTSELNNNDLLNKSLKSYSGALELKFNENTKYNYDYVLNLLKKKQDKEGKQNTEDKDESGKEDKQNNSSQEENENNGEDSGTGSTDNKTGSGETNESEELGENSKNTIIDKELTNGEYQELQKYKEELLEFEKNNKHLFNKQEETESFFDSFTNQNKKDW